jgi:hypothetical protein
MRTPVRRTSFALCDVLLLMLVALGCSVTPGRSLTAQQDSDDLRSVSGTIASLQENGFTLTLASAISDHNLRTTSPPSSGQAEGGRYRDTPQTTPKSLTFRMDKNTTIDGKLRVGANAKVTYREAKGGNLAVNVRVGS